MRSLLGVMLLCTMSWVASAQEEDSEYDENYEFPESKSLNTSLINIGIGMGLDYGGLGGKLSFQPVPNIALFGALGYNFNGAGYNGGIIYRIAPTKKVCPFLTAMYGYNAVIVVENASDLSRTYYGASFGGGIHLNRKDKPNFWNFELLIPSRSAQYKSDVQIWKANDPGFEEALPITISVGYHFGL